MSDQKDRFDKLYDLAYVFLIGKLPGRSYTKVGLTLIAFGGTWLAGTMFLTGDLMAFVQTETITAGAKVSVTNEPANWEKYFSYSLSAVLIFSGLAAVILGLRKNNQYHNDQRVSNSRKVTLVCEHRGVQNDAVTPLIDAINIEHGQKRSQVWDQRSYIKDKRVTHPVDAFNVINRADQDLKAHKGHISDSDFRIVFGGIAPVPFTFFMGWKIRNMSKMDVLDWDRDQTQLRWRDLSDPDDGDTFKVDLPEEAKTATEICVAISSSYPVKVHEVEKQFPNVPLVEMKLINHHVSNHWSDKKQERMIREIHKTIGNLNQCQKINLFIAGQNSLVFNIGRRWEPLFPETLMYKDDYDTPGPAFPWFIRFKRSEDPKIEFIDPTTATSKVS